MKDISVLLKRLRTGNYADCVTFGVPWKKGEISKSTCFKASDDGGNSLPLQSSFRAYWPDGSVKWSLHTTQLPYNSRHVLLSTAEDAQTLTPAAVRDEAEELDIRLDMLHVHFKKDGSCVPTVEYNGISYLEGGDLTAKVTHRSTGKGHLRQDTLDYSGQAVSYTLEEKGPLRIVLKIEGHHRPADPEAEDFPKEALPFTLRYYFRLGCPEIKISHSFCYDMDHLKDFVQGIGIVCNTPMDGPAYNRHIRIAGENGFLKESLVLLRSWRPALSSTLFERQINGEFLDLKEKTNPDVFTAMKNMNHWDSYRIIQDSSEHYRVQKGTGHDDICSLVDSIEGRRAPGFMYVGTEKKGIGLGLRDFWQKYPSGLDASGLLSSQASLTAWFWTPSEEPMDFRYIDTIGCSQSYYGPGNVSRCIPYGVSVSNDVSIFFYGEKTPPDERLLIDIEKMQRPEVLVCEPSYYHEVEAFGKWSLPSRETEKKAWLEDRLDAAIRFYQKEIEDRKWYGLWNYGDIMHTYDDIRHCWRYDMGGYAWQNTELVPTLWLWYSFLRTGREDIFDMAEAMARHTSDVDILHIGPFKGLGTRHNVKHWGGSAKEARISMCGHHRFYYYLTGNEHVGDIMDQVKDVDFTTIEQDPLRNHYKNESNPPYPTHARSGPDWSSYCANWMTRWERFEDEHYGDKIKTGIQCISHAPFRLISGVDFGYDPHSGILTYIGETSTGGSHLAACMGGPQIYVELADILEDPLWEDMLVQYGSFYYLSTEEKIAATNREVGSKDWSFPSSAATLAAYAAWKKRDAALGKKVWDVLVGERQKHDFICSTVSDYPTMEKLEEIPWISTNSVSQWCLNVITSLEMAGDYLE